MYKVVVPSLSLATTLLALAQMGQFVLIIGSISELTTSWSVTVSPCGVNDFRVHYMRGQIFYNLTTENY